MCLDQIITAALYASSVERLRRAILQKVPALNILSPEPLTTLLIMQSVVTCVLNVSKDCAVISAGAEAGGPTVQAKHLRGIWTGQL